ncbi:hypothetical protein B0H12DRAFT_1274306 [Mycena haematopus]|nr:hypothetical protein B0H12DRAFT_1274306 [Mycena haematopus]
MPEIRYRGRSAAADLVAADNPSSAKIVARPRGRESLYISRLKGQERLDWIVRIVAYARSLSLSANLQWSKAEMDVACKMIMTDGIVGDRLLEAMARVSASFASDRGAASERHEARDKHATTTSCLSYATSLSQERREARPVQVSEGPPPSLNLCDAPLVRPCSTHAETVPFKPATSTSDTAHRCTVHDGSRLQHRRGSINSSACSSWSQVAPTPAASQMGTQRQRQSTAHLRAHYRAKDPPHNSKDFDFSRRSCGSSIFTGCMPTRSRSTGSAENVVDVDNSSTVGSGGAAKKRHKNGEKVSVSRHPRVSSIFSGSRTNFHDEAAALKTSTSHSIRGAHRCRTHDDSSSKIFESCRSRSISRSSYAAASILKESDKQGMNSMKCTKNQDHKRRNSVRDYNRSSDRTAKNSAPLQDVKPSGDEIHAIHRINEEAVVPGRALRDVMHKAQPHVKRSLNSSRPSLVYCFSLVSSLSVYQAGGAGYQAGGAGAGNAGSAPKSLHGHSVHLDSSQVHDSAQSRATADRSRLRKTSICSRSRSHARVPSRSRSREARILAFDYFDSRSRQTSSETKQLFKTMVENMDDLNDPPSGSAARTAKKNQENAGENSVGYNSQGHSHSCYRTDVEVDAGEAGTFLRCSSKSSPPHISTDTESHSQESDPHTRIRTRHSASYIMHSPCAAASILKEYDETGGDSLVRSKRCDDNHRASLHNCKLRRSSLKKGSVSSTTVSRTARADSGNAESDPESRRQVRACSRSREHDTDACSRADEITHPSSNKSDAAKLELQDVEGFSLWNPVHTDSTSAQTLQGGRPDSGSVPSAAVEKIIPNIFDSDDNNYYHRVDNSQVEFAVSARKYGVADDKKIASSYERNQSIRDHNAEQRHSYASHSAQSPTKCESKSKGFLQLAAVHRDVMKCYHLVNCEPVRNEPHKQDYCPDEERIIRQEISRPIGRDGGGESGLGFISHAGSAHHVTRVEAHPEERGSRTKELGSRTKDGRGSSVMLPIDLSLSCSVHSRSRVRERLPSAVWNPPAAVIPQQDVCNLASAPVSPTNQSGPALQSSAQAAGPNHRKSRYPSCSLQSVNMASRKTATSQSNPTVIVVNDYPSIVVAHVVKEKRRNIEAISVSFDSQIASRLHKDMDGQAGAGDAGTIFPFSRKADTHSSRTHGELRPKECDSLTKTTLCHTRSSSRSIHPVAWTLKEQDDPGVHAERAKYRDDEQRSSSHTSTHSSSSNATKSAVSKNMNLNSSDEKSLVYNQSARRMNNAMIVHGSTPPDKSSEVLRCGCNKKMDTSLSRESRLSSSPYSLDDSISTSRTGGAELDLGNAESALKLSHTSSVHFDSSRVHASFSSHEAWTLSQSSGTNVCSHSRFWPCSTKASLHCADSGVRDTRVRYWSPSANVRSHSRTRDPSIAHVRYSHPHPESVGFRDCETSSEFCPARNGSCLKDKNHCRHSPFVFFSDKEEEQKFSRACTRTIIDDTDRRLAETPKVSSGEIVELELKARTLKDKVRTAIEDAHLRRIAVKRSKPKLEAMSREKARVVVEACQLTDNEMVHRETARPLRCTESQIHCSTLTAQFARRHGSKSTRHILPQGLFSKDESRDVRQCSDCLPPKSLDGSSSILGRATGKKFKSDDDTHHRRANWHRPDFFGTLEKFDAHAADTAYILVASDMLKTKSLAAATTYCDPETREMIAQSYGLCGGDVPIIGDGNV